MRHWLLILAIVFSAGAAWAIHAASVQKRADDLRKLADEACKRFDFAAAHGHLVSYLQLRPADAEGHLLAARCARRAEFLEDYAGPDSDLIERAEGHLRDAQRLGILPATIALERTLSGFQHGAWSESERTLFEQVTQRTPEAPLLLEGLIHGYIRGIHFEKALGCANALLKLEPSNAQAFLWRGRLREEIKQKKGAREDYESALNLVPQFDAARYYLAELLFNSNQIPDAEAQLKVLNERAQDNLLVRLMWARCRIALGDESLGRELLDAWLVDAPPHHPRLLDALNAGARAAFFTGQPGDAESYARRALQESPLNQYALYDLARSLNMQGRRQEAHAIEVQFEKVNQDLGLVARDRERLAQDPSNLNLRHELGDAYLRLARPAEALMWLNSVLDRDPNHRPTLESLAKYHAQSGHPDLAVQMRDRLVGLEPAQH